MMTVPLWRKLAVFAALVGVEALLIHLLGNDDSGLWITLGLLVVFGTWAPNYLIAWPGFRNPLARLTRAEGAVIGGIAIGAGLVWHFTHLVLAVVAWAVVVGAALGALEVRRDRRSAEQRRERWKEEQRKMAATYSRWRTEVRREPQAEDRR